MEVARRHGDYAVCGVGVLVELDQELRIGSARAALISVGLPVPVDLTDALGGQPDAADWAAAGRRGRRRPRGRHHASAYRRHLAEVLTARAARAAAAPPPGGGRMSEALHETRLVVNGVPHTVQVPARLLADCLRLG